MAATHREPSSLVFSILQPLKRRSQDESYPSASNAHKYSAPDSGLASLHSQSQSESLINGSLQSRPRGTTTTSSSASSNETLCGISPPSQLQPHKPQSNKSLKFVGFHMSSTAGGPQRAIHHAQDMGARALSLFVRGARRWTAAPLSDDTVRKFRDKLARSSLSVDKIVCHGSHLINLGSPSSDILSKSRLSLIDEMQRCQRLGIKYYNIRPGSTCGKSAVTECMDRIVESVNEALGKTRGVTLLLETMCCQGYTIGGKWSELKGILNRVEDQGRIGVCLDTCRVYAAGNDIAIQDGWERFMLEFEREIGMEKLKAVQLKDSQLPVGSHLDRQIAIGTGWIGLGGFKLIMNDPRLNNIPMIIETSDTLFQQGIGMLYTLCED